MPAPESAQPSVPQTCGGPSSAGSPIATSDSSLIRTPATRVTVPSSSLQSSSSIRATTYGTAPTNAPTTAFGEMPTGRVARQLVVDLQPLAVPASAIALRTASLHAIDGVVRFEGRMCGVSPTPTMQYFSVNAPIVLLARGKTPRSPEGNVAFSFQAQYRRAGSRKF